MRKVTVYATEACATCDQVKALFEAREIPFEETIIARDSDAHTELADRTGMTSLPQVMIGNILVGGGDETIAADQSGILADLLVD